MKVGQPGWSRSQTLLAAITVFFCVNLVMTNVLAAKIVKVPFFSDVPISVSTLFYPLTFVITDIVAEVWGRREANRIGRCCITPVLKHAKTTTEITENTERGLDN